MIRIAIVEDRKSDYEILYAYIKKYEQEQKNTFYIKHFLSGDEFIRQYDRKYDIVFLDIELPDMNGLDIAKEIRKIDENIVIVFVTEMAQFAIKGYEVDALDFMVKPVSYFNFTNKLEKAVLAIRKANVKKLVLSQGSDTLIIPVDAIYYIEKIKNDILIHTLDGDCQTRQTITDMYEQLQSYGFSKCNSGCIVNMSRIDSVQEHTLTIHGDILPIARRLKKDFMMRYVQHFGGKTL